MGGRREGQRASPDTVSICCVSDSQPLNAPGGIDSKLPLSPVRGGSGGDAGKTFSGFCRLSMPSDTVPLELPAAPGVSVNDDKSLFPFLKLQKQKHRTILF